MSIGDIFGKIGHSGFGGPTPALQTTSNNIANTNTPGYSRQKPILEAREQSVADGE